MVSRRPTNGRLTTVHAHFLKHVGRVALRVEGITKILVVVPQEHVCVRGVLEHQRVAVERGRSFGIQILVYAEEMWGEAGVVGPGGPEDGLLGAEAEVVDLLADFAREAEEGRGGDALGELFFGCGRGGGVGRCCVGGWAADGVVGVEHDYVG